MNSLNGLASFDIVSIDQQYRRVANSLTRIAHVANGLNLVSLFLGVSILVHSYGLFV